MQELTDEELFDGEYKSFKLIMMDVEGKPVNKERLNSSFHISAKADKRRQRNTAANQTKIQSIVYAVEKGKYSLEGGIEDLCDVGILNAKNILRGAPAQLEAKKKG